MPDTPGQVATNRDTNYSLTIDEAAALYARAGHPRTPRSVQRYCASGHLDCIKEATTLGDKYFVDPASVSRHIAQIDELISLDMRATGRDLSRPVASETIEHTPRDEARHEHTTGALMSSPIAPRPTERIQPNATSDSARQSPTVGDDPSRHVVQLEREVSQLTNDREFLRDQIKVKDTQINSLLERDRETNILMRGLYEMLTPLLGPPRHERRPEDGDQPR